MNNKNTKNIIILVVVAIVFGVIGYLIPHPVSHHHKPGGRNTKNSVVSTNKGKHSTLIHIEGSVSNISNNTLTVNGSSIIVGKGTKIYSGNTLVSISSISNTSTISIIGAKNKTGIIARFIIIL